MILTILFGIGLSIIMLIATITGLVSFALPPQFYASIAKIIGSTSVLQGIFPVKTLLTALMVVFTVWVAKYSLNVVVWLLNFIPGIKNSTFQSFINERSGSSVVEKRTYYKH